MEYCSSFNNKCENQKGEIMGQHCCTPEKSCKKVKLQPLGNRILVRRLAAEEKLKGGIIVPDTAKKKQEQASVVAVGTGKKDKNGNLIPMPVKVGDTIL